MIGDIRRHRYNSLLDSMGLAKSLTKSLFEQGHIITGITIYPDSVRITVSWSELVEHWPIHDRLSYDVAIHPQHPEIRATRGKP